MAVAQPDIDALLDDLNNVRASGVYLKNEILIRNLKKKIEKLKAQDYTAFHMHMASLYCVIGDVGQMKYHSKLGMNNAHPHAMAFNSVTFENIGFFTESRKIIDLIEIENYEEDGILDEHLVEMAISVFSFELMVPILKKVNSAQFPEIYAAHEILSQNNIEEHVVLSMLDVAGKTMREHELLKASDIIILPDYKKRTISVSIPVNLSPADMAALEWEFVTRLFEEVPNAPFQTIHVGFCSIA